MNFTIEFEDWQNSEINSEIINPVNLEILS